MPFTVPGRARSYETPYDRQESKTRRELPVIGTGMLDVRRLETLLEVARTGSFAAAAESLSFTPSAVSPAFVALLIAAYALGRHASPREGLAGLALAAAGFSALNLVRGEGFEAAIAGSLQFSVLTK